MGGIINYYHGESGVVTHHQYIVTEQQNVHALHLRDDPHRQFGYDYGADIGIDPIVKLDDRVVFIRMDQYSGIWVREQDQLYPNLQQAISRVTEERTRGLKAGQVRIRVHGVWAEQYIADLTQAQTGNPFVDRPATDVSFFLSFSSANVLLARQVFDDLKYDAKVDVWFDLDQAGESPNHESQIEAWLRGAVFRCRGFVLLWTRSAKDSAWVRKEISWASDIASRDHNFHFIVLKLEDEPITSEILDRGQIVDCYDLWPVNGVAEELFAAVIGRHGRTAWLRQHRERGFEIQRDEGACGYEPFRSDSGKAISLSYGEDDGEFAWHLDYERNGTRKTADGRGGDEAVDLEIRSGEDIAFYVCHRAPLVRFWPGTPLWMRSRDLRILPENVLAMYKRLASKARIKEDA